MKVGIFDPYFDTLGGGEKYISDIASYFLQEHEVFLFWNEEEAVKKAEARFQVSLTNLKVIKNIFTPSGNVVEKFLVTSKFDMLFYFSDGSVPLLFSKKNILIFQFPVNWIVKPGLFTKIKFHNIQKVLCYSDFVK